MFIKIVIIIGIAWIIQIGFGYLQLRDFNKNFKQMHRQGRVVIGKSKGKVRRGSVILIGIDKDCYITESRIMRGITILARFKTMEILNGENLHSIKKQKLNGLDKSTRYAIENGIKNYNDYYKNELENNKIK